MTHPRGSQTPTRTTQPWIIVLFAVALIMLVATIFYPFGYDQAVFSTAGEMILHGAIPYRNFLDTKPPLIYYIYAFAIWIVGHHESSIHVFDIIWQVITAYYLFRILRRYLPTDHSLAAVSLTLLIYAGSGFWMTAQAESFAILPSLVLLDATLRSVEGRRGTIYWGIFAGAATAILFALKFTLVLGGLASLLFIFVWRGITATKRIQFIAGFFLGSLILLLLGGWALWMAGAWEPFIRSLSWLSRYASLLPVQHSWIAELLLIFPERIVYSMSVSIAILAIIGCIQWFRNRTSEPPGNSLRILLTLTFLFQLAGIVLERKIEFPYQYMRATWAITPFAAGILLSGLKKYWNCSTGRRCTLSIVLLAGLLVLSPLVRIVTQTIPWTSIAATGRDAAAEVQKRIPDYYAEEQHQVATYLDERMAKSDNFFFWGNDAGIYFFANRLPQTICLTATPLRTGFTPSAWKAKLMNQLTTVSPKYWVIEFGDARPYITGSSLDSYQALLHWPELAEILRSNYVPDTTIGHFALFRKKPI